MISMDSGRDIKEENEAQTKGERRQRISGLCVFAKTEVSMCLYAESKAPMQSRRLGNRRGNQGD